MFDSSLFFKDIQAVVAKHEESSGGKICAFISAVAYIDNGAVMTRGGTMIPVPARDHEEQLLRDKSARDVNNIVTALTKNVYEGR